MLLTCFLILLRVILFAWLPELRTLHGMILMAYLISFLIGALLLAIIKIMYEYDVIIQEACTGISFVIYFSILTAYFWRNIMCYDIWWTFSCKQAFSSRGRNAYTRTRFHLYSAYAFGAPTAFTVLLGVLEFLDFPKKHRYSNFMPNLRLRACFLYGYSKLLYLCGPIIVLFIINVIFTTFTAVKISTIKKETKKVLQSNESSTHDQQKATRR
ncbi:G-protein coupled receptor Mth2-like [Trichoplusia ni]|uniref:G-protein coupled receptor Mth2-like n=1 Tax=Trichoplusia ni TaxID=7111 RepID=A0A7E5WEW4_TRINI|nr:G-protein coupled receptor Mth2-like [Trichoplusia ni]